MLDQIEIIDEGEEERFLLEEVPGIEVDVGTVDSSLFYELKVPLNTAPGTPFGIGFQPDKSLGIGFETPRMKRPMNRSRGRMGGGMRGGMGGGDMGGGSMGSRRPGMGGRPQFEPLKVWMEVKLAAQE